MKASQVLANEGHCTPYDRMLLVSNNYWNIAELSYKSFKADRKSISLSLDQSLDKFEGSKPLVVFNPVGERIEVVARMHVCYRLLLKRIVRYPTEQHIEESSDASNADEPQ